MRAPRRRRPRDRAHGPAAPARRALDRVGDDRRGRRGEPRARRARASRSSSDGITYRIRLVSSDPDAYDRFYNVIANPLLWFIQHYLWDLSNVPDIRHAASARRGSDGYKRVNEDLARGRARGDRGPRRAARDGPRLPPLHRARRIIRRGAPGRVPAPLRPHPVDRSRTPGACCPSDMRTEIFEGLLANDIIGFHTRSYCNNFLQCCRELMGLDTDFQRGAVTARTAARPGCAPYPLRDRRARASSEVAASEGVARARAGDPAPAARAPDPARRPGRPLEERAARLHRVRHLPRAASRVPRAGHVHRPPPALAPGRARVRRVPGEDRGARGGHQPPPRHHRLDADRPAPARRLRGGGRALQALRPAAGERDVGRDEPRRPRRARW